MSEAKTGLYLGISVPTSTSQLVFVSKVPMSDVNHKESADPMLTFGPPADTLSRHTPVGNYS